MGRYHPKVAEKSATELEWELEQIENGRRRYNVSLSGPFHRGLYWMSDGGLGRSRPARWVPRDSEEAKDDWAAQIERGKAFLRQINR